MTTEQTDSIRPRPGNRRPTSIAEALERIYAQKSLPAALSRESLLELPVQDDPCDDEALIDRLTSEDPHLTGCLKLWITIANADVASPSLKRLTTLAHRAVQHHAALDQDAVEAIERGGLTRSQVARLVHPGHEGDRMTPSQRELLIDNAFLSLLLSRVASGQITKEAFIQDLGEDLWSEKIRINAAPAAARLASGSKSKEQQLVWQFHAESVASLRDQAIQAQAHATAAEADAARWEHTSQRLATNLEAAVQHGEEMEQQLLELQEALRVERDRRQIDQHHHVDDVEGLRTSVIRNLSAQVDLLADGLHAIRNGKADIAEEFLDRALISLQKQREQLRNRGDDR